MSAPAPPHPPPPTHGWATGLPRAPDALYAPGGLSRTLRPLDGSSAPAPGALALPAAVASFLPAVDQSAPAIQGASAGMVPEIIQVQIPQQGHRRPGRAPAAARGADAAGPAEPAPAAAAPGGGAAARRLAERLAAPAGGGGSALVVAGAAAGAAGRRLLQAGVGDITRDDFVKRNNTVYAYEVSVTTDASAAGQDVLLLDSTQDIMIQVTGRLGWRRRRGAHPPTLSLPRVWQRTSGPRLARARSGPSAACWLRRAPLARGRNGVLSSGWRRLGPYRPSGAHSDHHAGLCGQGQAHHHHRAQYRVRPARALRHRHVGCAARGGLVGAGCARQRACACRGVGG